MEPMVPSSMEPMVSSGMTSMDPTPGDPVCGEAESTDQLDRNDSLVKKLPGKLREKGLCKVCGDTATGMYFGALVCVPCKTFFLRYAGDNFAFRCKRDKGCEIVTATRTQCKYCRYQKCLHVGMTRKERPSHVQLRDGQQQCVVCLDLANGVHFGAVTCEGCKKFFRRGLTEHESYQCKLDKSCPINPRTRNACRYCRYQKCINAGMSREAIQMGRPSKVRYSSESGCVDMNLSTNNSNGAGDVTCTNDSTQRSDGGHTDRNADRHNTPHFGGNSSDSTNRGGYYRTGPMEIAGNSTSTGNSGMSSLGSISSASEMHDGRKTGKKDQRGSGPMENGAQIRNGVANYRGTMQNHGSLPDLTVTPPTMTFDLTHDNMGHGGYYHGGGSTMPSTMPSVGPMTQAGIFSDLAIKTECEELPSPCDSVDESTQGIMGFGDLRDRTEQLGIELATNLLASVSADNMGGCSVQNMGSNYIKAEHHDSCQSPGELRRSFMGGVNPGYNNARMSGLVAPHGGPMFGDKDRVNNMHMPNGAAMGGHRPVLPPGGGGGWDNGQYAQGGFARCAPQRYPLPPHHGMGGFGMAHEMDTVPKRRRLSAPPSHLQTQQECHPSDGHGYDQMRHLVASPVQHLAQHVQPSPPPAHLPAQNVSHLTPPSPLLHHSPQPQTPSPLPLQPTPPLSQPQTPSPQQTPPPVILHHSQSPTSLPLAPLVAPSRLHGTGGVIQAPFHQQQQMQQQQPLPLPRLPMQQLQQHRPQQPLHQPLHQRPSAQGHDLQWQNSEPYQAKQSVPEKQQQLPQQQQQQQQQQQPQQQQSSVWSTSVAISRLVDHTSSSVTGGLGVAQQLSQEILLAIKDDAVKEKPGTPVVSCNEDTDADLTYVDGYWVEPKLPDENVFFTESHRWIIDHIMKAYNKFVETGTKINKQINTEFEEWRKENPDVDPEKIPPEFLRIKLVRLYTLSSVNYCESLPGFHELNETDQYTILRFGQSQSRILVAAQHWYDPDLEEFHNFYPWKPKPPRPDYKFRQDVLRYSRVMRSLEMDLIEASLLNALVLIAADFPGLNDCGVIEEKRAEVLKAFRAYTTVKYGTPNSRIEELFQHIPKLRDIGLYHHRMTFSMPYVPDSEQDDDVDS